MYKLPVHNHLADFYELHPDCRAIIGLYLLAWEEEYGDDIICDIATSKAESKAKHEAYTAAGYIFKDENAFGHGSETLGYISCYLPLSAARKPKNQII